MVIRVFGLGEFVFCFKLVVFFEGGSGLEVFWEFYLGFGRCIGLCRGLYCYVLNNVFYVDVV